jgi:hypothetical protein
MRFYYKTYFKIRYKLSLDIINHKTNFYVATNQLKISII